MFGHWLVHSLLVSEFSGVSQVPLLVASGFWCISQFADQVLRGHSLSVSLCSSESLFCGQDHLSTSRVRFQVITCSEELMIFMLFVFFAPLDIAACNLFIAAFSPFIESIIMMFSAGTSCLVSYSRVSVLSWCHSWRQVAFLSVVVIVCRLDNQVRLQPVHGLILQWVKGLIFESVIWPVRQPVRLPVPAWTSVRPFI